MTEDRIGKSARATYRIGNSLAAAPGSALVGGVAAHRRGFRTRNMIRELVDFSEAARSGSDPIAAFAVEALKSVGRA